MNQTANKKIDIRSLTLDQIEKYFEKNGEQKYRAKQVDEWLWQKSVCDFDEMTSLSKHIREQLKHDFTINNVAVHKMIRSEDGTIKNIIKLFDGELVESVLIPTEKRITACISSQVGCSLDCHFCATGKLKRVRNLKPDEIYDQVVVIKNQSIKYFSRPLTNIVFMGMGEPLLNYQNVLSAIDKITSDIGLGVSSKRITISTVGIPKMIEKLADDKVKFNLAISLHSAIDSIRTSIMPINKSNSIQLLLNSVEYWFQATGKKITFEYVVWQGINDRKTDAEALVTLCKKVPCKVNIIEYNPIGDSRFAQASQNAVDYYKKLLEENNIVVNIRKSRGDDIDAACGQLANKSI